jgi:hypothetical protein
MYPVDPIDLEILDMTVFLTWRIPALFGIDRGFVAIQGTMPWC